MKPPVNLFAITAAFCITLHADDAAIEAGAKGAEIKRVQHIMRGGKVMYEALHVKKGKETEIEYLEDGSPKPE